MQIDPYMNVRRYAGAAPVKPGRADKTDSSSPEVSFEGADGLNSALASVPDVRPEAVSRAQALIADPNYPSEGTLKELAGFLSRQLLTEQA